MGSYACAISRFSHWNKFLRRKLILHWTEKKFEVGTVSSLSILGIKDYEQERRAWKVSVPDKFNFASDVIDVWSQKEKTGLRKATIPAFWYVSENGEEIKWNFQSLEQETKRTANVLQRLCGLEKGDNVFIMLPKIPEFWLVSIAAIRIGFVLSPCSMMLTAKDLSYRFSTFKPSCIIAHDSVAEMVDEVAALFPALKAKVIVSETNHGSRKGWLDFRPAQQTVDSNHKCAKTSSDESMMVFFTSGTTGQPKMVEHTHASYGMGHQVTGKYVLDSNEEKIIWNMSDTGWSKTAYGFFGPWFHGSGVFIHRMPQFSTSLIFQVLSQYPIDTFCGPPMAFRAMVQENLTDKRFCKLSHCVSGGEPLTSEVIKRWEGGTGLKIYEGYGQTETVAAVAMMKCLDYKPGSCGKPLPGMNVVILDENENELGPGVKGEIALKRNAQGQTFGLFKGYKNDPEKTKQCLTEKYYHTGDMAYYDEDGYFWYIGRNDDLINSAGYRIGPYEVESALMEHPAVAEVTVTSSPDANRGEVVKAFIVLNKAYLHKSKLELTKEIQEHTKKITAPYKYPRKIDFVKELPKTASGKVKKFELRNMEWRENVTEI